MKSNLSNSNSAASSNTPANSLKDKKWELLGGVKKGLEEISNEVGNNPDVKSLIEQTDKIQEMRGKICTQSENLKLSLLISSRERNVYLEKLRKIEEFCEDKNWEDKDGMLKDIYNILYGDN